MYRAVTLAALRAGIDVSNPQAMQRLMDELHIEMPPGRVLLNGEEVSQQIRAGAVTAASGAVADSVIVRRRLVELQRQIASERNMVCEGRDQGTIVFPEATCKFFLVAQPEERARRRQQEMAKRGENVPWDEVLQAQEVRDARDRQRDLAPMVPASDAIVLDSTQLTLEQIVERMEEHVRLRQKKEV
jgi:cytidylate kinase